MGMNDCPRFKSCGAPLCPLSKKATRIGVWYANEDICKRPDVRRMFKFPMMQMKIKRKAPNAEGMFNVEMLLRLTKVGKKIHGLKDTKYRDTYKTWLEAHPIRVLTEEQIAERKARYARLAEIGKKNVIPRKKAVLSREILGTRP